MTNSNNTAKTEAANKEVVIKEVSTSWVNAQNVAALAAAGTAAVTMVGKRNCDVGALVGAAAGVGAAYLGTKWISETMGIQENGFGKALGLFIGIDLGYGLTNLGIKVHNERATEENTNEAYL